MSLSWPWHFVTVSEAEKQHRRDLLDVRGYYAQFSVLIAILLIRLFNTFTRSGQQSAKPNTRTKQRSWLDSPPFPGWFKSRRHYIVSLIWLAWLVSLSGWNTGDDYLHLTKALGHVGLSQLPVQVLMSPALYISTSRSRSSSLVSVLTSIPQPALTPYHRVFGRIVISPLLVGHATLYCLFFLQSNHPGFNSLFAKRVLDQDVQWGLTAVTMAVLVMFFGRPTGTASGLWSGSIKTRRQTFYIVHVLLVGSLCLAVYFHVTQAQMFVLESLAGFMVNLGCCWMTAQ